MWRFQYLVRDPVKSALIDLITTDMGKMKDGKFITYFQVDNWFLVTYALDDIVVEKEQ